MEDALGGRVSACLLHCGSEPPGMSLVLGPSPAPGTEARTHFENDAYALTDSGSAVVFPF